MLVQIWINGNGVYKFYLADYIEDRPKHYYVYKNEQYDGAYDTLAECKEYTVDYDKLWGDDTFSLPK